VIQLIKVNCLNQSNSFYQIVLKLSDIRPELIKTVDYITITKGVFMRNVTLNFNYPEDEGLNLTGTISFPDSVGITIDQLSIRGLGEWRHVPSNVIHANQATIESLKLIENSTKFSKIGINWIGLKAEYDLLLSYTVRSGKNGTKKVQEQLTKFFKAIGATKIVFNVKDIESFNDDDVQDDETN
jgi:hypothetical protein